MYTKMYTQKLSLWLYRFGRVVIICRNSMYTIPNLYAQILQKIQSKCIFDEKCLGADKDWSRNVKLPVMSGLKIDFNRLNHISLCLSYNMN